MLCQKCIDAAAYCLKVVVQNDTPNKVDCFHYCSMKVDITLYTFMILALFAL